MICGGSSSSYAPPGQQPAAPRVMLWRCPMCKGAGAWESGERCLECVGFGLVADEPDPRVWVGDGEHVRAPLPPALMPAPCGDCAFRTGSPEEESGYHARGNISAERPFFCHHQLHDTGTEYVPAATWNGAPLGAMLCRGWWDTHVEHLPAPPRAYREPRTKGTP